MPPSEFRNLGVPRAPDWSLGFYRLAGPPDNATPPEASTTKANRKNANNAYWLQQAAADWECQAAECHAELATAYLTRGSNRYWAPTGNFFTDGPGHFLYAGNSGYTGALEFLAELPTRMYATRPTLFHAPLAALELRSGVGPFAGTALALPGMATYSPAVYTGFGFGPTAPTNLRIAAGAYGPAAASTELLAASALPLAFAQARSGGARFRGSVRQTTEGRLAHDGSATYQSFGANSGEMAGGGWKNNPEFRLLRAHLEKTTSDYWGRGDYLEFRPRPFATAIAPIQPLTISAGGAGPIAGGAYLLQRGASGAGLWLTLGDIRPNDSLLATIWRLGGARLARIRHAVSLTPWFFSRGESQDGSAEGQRNREKPLRVLYQLTLFFGDHGWRWQSEWVQGVPGYRLWLPTGDDFYTSGADELPPDIPFNGWDTERPETNFAALRADGNFYRHALQWTHRGAQNSRWFLRADALFRQVKRQEGDGSGMPVEIALQFGFQLRRW